MMRALFGYGEGFFLDTLCVDEIVIKTHYRNGPLSSEVNDNSPKYYSIFFLHTTNSSRTHHTSAYGRDLVPRGEANAIFFCVRVFVSVLTSS